MVINCALKAIFGTVECCKGIFIVAIDVESGLHPGAVDEAGNLSLAFCHSALDQPLNSSCLPLKKFPPDQYQIMFPQILGPWLLSMAYYI